MRKITAFFALAGVAAVLTPGVAFAQDDLTAMDVGQLRGEVERRYDAALGMTNDAAIVAANDPRYLWASEAKVQCGIALGFLKSNTRDETSLSKCGLAYDMMMREPRQLVVEAPPPETPACNRDAPGLIFFEFDSAEPGPDAIQIVEYVTQNAGPCTWRNFIVTGHADRAGSNAYNLGLSQRRADAVADLMATRGIPRSAITTGAEGEENPRVPTVDGVRELQNRRVEIQASQ